MTGNQAVQRIIWTGWILLGWIGLILLAGLATLILLSNVSHFIVSGPWHDPTATLFVIVVWPVITLGFRLCAKHWLWLLLGF